MINWEGAELCYYINGESHAISLSDIQFATVVKILGLQISENGDVQCFSDESLRQLHGMKSNPLHLRERER